MKQEVFCYIKGQEHVHFLNLNGSLEAHDILVEFVMQISELGDLSPRDVLHDVAGKLQVLTNEKALV